MPEPEEKDHDDRQGAKMTPTSKIIEVAILRSQMDAYAEEQPDLIARDNQLTKDFTDLDHIRALIAYKLVKGEPYGIWGDNQEIIDAAKSIAADMGATVEKTPAPPWIGEVETSIVLRPAG